MNLDRARRIKELYTEALERDRETRAEFLDVACSGDEDLRREVESLLAFETQAAAFIERPALEELADVLNLSAARENARPVVGRQFGSYRVIAPLGSGGMGEVYLATDTRLGRQAALKLLPVQFTGDSERVRRFEQEARAASSLNHPNIVTVYEIGEAPDEDRRQRFIATEFIDGETLRKRLSGGRLKIEMALDLATQVAAALVAAHSAGIIHRDIKPENIMLRRDGYLKVLDFGLAKLTETRSPVGTESLTSDFETNLMRESLTGPGVVMGTARYMSPEQARGLDVDPRTDIFSLGVVLYEMVAGRAPFAGQTMSDVIASILITQPARLGDLAPDAPAKVETIVFRALAKNRDERYSTAEELLRELKELREEISFSAKLKEQAGHSVEPVERSVTRRQGPGEESLVGPLARAIGRARPRSPTGGIVLVSLLLLAVVGLWFVVRQRNLEWASNQVPEIEKLAQAQRNFEAYDLALSSLKYIPENQKIAELIPKISDNLTVSSQPPGARVFLKRFSTTSQPSTRELIGVTPINNLRIARGEYVITLEKDGFAPFSRTISGKLYHWGTAMLPPDEPTRVEQRLIETGSLPPRMVFVPGGEYRLVSWDKPTNVKSRLDDYFMDEYEVTNREYKEFIAAGGYLKEQYWKYPFIKDGRVVPWAEAMAQFKDRTQLAGPRNWAGQGYLEGRATHPVTDVTWYEAAAYAEFRGKSLPTVFQWEKAARNGLFTHYSANIMPWGPIDVASATDGRANFKSDGTRPTGSFEFGMSPFGCYDMAGNVAEWCLNQTSAGFIALGASWDDLAYLFGYVGELPSFHSSGKLGFRCVVNPKEAKADQGGMKIDTVGHIPAYAPATVATFQSLVNYYRYDSGPLEARLVETIETAEWRREKIHYLGAREEQVIAYLYLPKNYTPPFQVIQFVPAGDVYGGYVTLAESLEMVLAPHIKAGRAVFAVVFKGFKERDHPPGYKPPGSSSIRRRDELVGNATDLRRGLDYLSSRDDIDPGRIAYFGYSQGATEGLIFSALDERYRTVVLVAGGLWGPGNNALPEVTHANFAAHIRVPKLMINGRYDEVHSFTRVIEPLYKLLPEKKKLVLYDGSHSPPIEIAVPAINQWLDETLGPVRR